MPEQPKRKRSLDDVLKERAKEQKKAPLIERQATWEELDRAFRKNGRPLFGK